MMKVQVMADTQHRDYRLTSFYLVFPQIIVKELERHRVFSFAAFSQRAVGLERNIARIKGDMWKPLNWLPDHKGMHTDEILAERSELDNLHTELFHETMKYVRDFQKRNVSHQLINRYIEHFGYMHMIVTGTEWDNFFRQRLGNRAEQHIKKLAEMMLEARESSLPMLVDRTDYWHMPYVGSVKEAAGKVARVSFDQNKAFTKEQNESLALGIFQNREMSPFEHIAVPMGDLENRFLKVYPDKTEKGWCNNFRGFIQLRYLLENGLYDLQNEKFIAR